MFWVLEQHESMGNSRSLERGLPKAKTSNAEGELWRDQHTYQGGGEMPQTLEICGLPLKRLRKAPFK